MSIFYYSSLFNNDINKYKFEFIKKHDTKCKIECTMDNGHSILLERRINLSVVISNGPTGIN